MKALSSLALLALGSSVNAFADFSYGTSVLPSLEEYKFRDWMRHYGKRYHTRQEYQFRYQVFKNNLKQITKVDERHESYKQGLNQWSDMTDEDFDNVVIEMPSESFLKYSETEYTDDNSNLPKSINWVKRGYITPVKETDRDCTIASYAFAAADTVEALYKKQTGQLEELSTKQMMDCGGAFSLVECRAGRIEKAFEYIQSGNKLEFEKDYPYNRQQSECRYDRSRGKAGIGSIKTVQVDPRYVKQALQNGPVASVIAMKNVIRKYKKGVITAKDNCGSQPQVYVVIVGYGVENGEEFFLVKNNWGEEWGEHGYVKISTSSDNVCGILTPGFLYQVTMD